MRGLIFNYCLEYVESISDYAFVDDLIESSALTHNGSFADGGLYPDEELIRFCILASRELSWELDYFLEQFGEWIFTPLFFKLNTIYGMDAYHQSKIKSAFDFIVMLDIIHYKEVVKLYPDSQFPHFDVLHRNENVLVMEYRSKRKLHHLAKGMLLGCGKHFNENFSIQMEPTEGNTTMKFTVTKADS